MKIEFTPTMSDSMFGIMVTSIIFVFVMGISLGIMVEENEQKIENFNCDELLDFIKYKEYAQPTQIERYLSKCISSQQSLDNVSKK
jgi:hypothetical protein